MTGFFIGIFIFIIGITLYAIWSRWEYVRGSKKPPGKGGDDNGQQPDN